MKKAPYLLLCILVVTDTGSKGHYLKIIPHIKLIGMVCETCLSSSAYFPWTPDYTQFILAFVSIYFMIFRNTILYVELRLIKSFNVM